MKETPDAYYLQSIDCNCNNCLYMIRDIEKFNRVKIERENYQRDIFDKKVAKMMEVPELRDKAIKMRFQYDNGTINYGYCSKLNKHVTFIPNTCQLETQECFKHRSSILK